MQTLKIIGATPTNRKNYEVLGEHRDNSLLEFTLSGYEITTAVISIGEGKHRHYPGKHIVQFLSNGGSIYGLELASGNKLALTSTMAARQIERAYNDPNRIYSCCLDEEQSMLLGVYIETYEDTLQDVFVAGSIVTGFRFCMMQNIFELNMEETAKWIKANYVQELSLVNGNVYLNDASVEQKIRDVNASMVMGQHYIELVRPEDVVYIRNSVKAN